jgi:tRNA 5-methylaminomethyl-2-thiouridine biosynthesis bifunctional protein
MPDHPAMSAPALFTATLDWTDPNTPRSVPGGVALRCGTVAETEAVTLTLTAHQLPARWRGQLRFVLMSTAFGLGHSVLAAWAAWLADPHRPAHLHLLAMDLHPVQAHDLLQAHAQGPWAAQARALAQAWPPATPGWHRLPLADGLDLTLAWGDPAHTLGQWQAQVDAFCLLPPLPPAPKLLALPASHSPLRHLQRMAAPGATVASPAADEGLCATLRQAGFVLTPADHGLRGHFSPRAPLAHRAAPGRQALAPSARSALVLGAGLAGAACAAALRRAGLQVEVIDGAAAPAQGASGNPGGLFHATLHPDDGPHARWNRAAALHLARALPGLQLPWQHTGLLRLAPEAAADELQALAQRLGLPADYVQALSAEAAQARSGTAATAPGWWYPQGGALPPAELVAAWLKGVNVRCGQPVSRVAPSARGWGVWQGLTLIAEAELLVLACGAQLPALLAPLDAELAAQLTPQRGQLSLLTAAQAQLGHYPAVPVAAGGYVLPLPGGGLCVGATSTAHDPDTSLREADHAANLRHWHRWCGAPEGVQAHGGRVAWRLLAPDRLPLLGGLIDPDQVPGPRATQADAWPRRPGLVLCGGFASRGITWSALAGEVVAALALGSPSPVERSLLDAVDPVRFRVRRHRASKP